MNEEEILTLNNYIESLYQAMQIGDIVFEPKHSSELYDLINKLLEENKQLKEQKRLILKNVKEWIRCSKCEQLEPDLVHEKYWNSFEQILRNIFKNYNTENLSDNDLKYKHYLEKENEELISQLQQKEDIINKAREELYIWGEILFPEFQQKMLEILEKSDSNE